MVNGEEIEIAQWPWLVHLWVCNEQLFGPIFLAEDEFLINYETQFYGVLLYGTVL